MSESFTLRLEALTFPEASGLAEAIESDWGLAPLAVAINETAADGSSWELLAYFGDEAMAEKARLRLQRPAAVIAGLPARNWVRDSLAGLAPVAAGRFQLHGSHDRGRRRAGGVALEIDAGTAFGTGHHGTTEGCLLALDAILKQHRPRRVLDVGSGTGVLAIAAARAARCAATATDIDPEAVRVTRSNALRNHVGPWLRSVKASGPRHPAIAAGAPYDLVFANILARPLVAMAHGLAALMAGRGLLVISGLTLDQRRWLEAVYRNHGLTLSRRYFLGNWATLVLVRPHKAKRPDAGAPGRS